MQWQAISDTALRFCCWDDEFVVYNIHSGDTHLLGSMAAQILLKLQQSPSDVATLTGLFTHLPLFEMKDELPLQIEHILADLNRLELITRS